MECLFSAQTPLFDKARNKTPNSFKCHAALFHHALHLVAQRQQYLKRSHIHSILTFLVESNQCLCDRLANSCRKGTQLVWELSVDKERVVITSTPEQATTDEGYYIEAIDSKADEQVHELTDLPTMDKRFYELFRKSCSPYICDTWPPPLTRIRMSTS